MNPMHDKMAGLREAAMRKRKAKPAHIEPDADEMGGPSDADADNAPPAPPFPPHAKHGITIAIGLPMHGKK